MPEIIGWKAWLQALDNFPDDVKTQLNIPTPAQPETSKQQEEYRKKNWAILEILRERFKPLLNIPTPAKSETSKQQEEYRKKNWAMLKKLGEIFGKWRKERNQVKKVVDLINVAPKDDDDPEKLQLRRCKKAKLCNGDSDPGELLSKQENRKSVIKFWILHVESVLFHIIHELYYTFPADETADAIFQDHCNKLKDLMTMNDGKVAITVTKVIEMIENAQGRERSFRGTINQLGDFIDLNRLDRFMELVHKIISQLMSVLSTARFADDSKQMTADEYDTCGGLLADSAWDMRLLEVRLNCAKSHIENNGISARIWGSWGSPVDVLCSPAPLQKELSAGYFKELLSDIDETEEVGNTAAFLASPLASAITGAVIYFDKGLNVMGVGVDSPIFKDLNIPGEKH